MTETLSLFSGLLVFLFGLRPFYSKVDGVFHVFVAIHNMTMSANQFSRIACFLGALRKKGTKTVPLGALFDCT